MRRALLIAVFVGLLFVDIFIVPMALLLMFLGIVFGAIAHVGDWLPLSLFSLGVGGGLLWLTMIVWNALRLAPGERRIAS